MQKSMKTNIGYFFGTSLLVIGFFINNYFDMTLQKVQLMLSSIEKRSVTLNPSVFEVIVQSESSDFTRYIDILFSKNILSQRFLHQTNQLY